METANKIVYNVAILLVPYSYLSILLLLLLFFHSPALVGPLLLYLAAAERTQKKTTKLCPERPELTCQRSPEQTGPAPRREQWVTFQSPFTAFFSLLFSFSNYCVKRLVKYDQDLYFDLMNDFIIMCSLNGLNGWAMDGLFGCAESIRDLFVCIPFDWRLMPGDL